MQIKAFRDLLVKYQDYNTNPGNTTLERVTERMLQDFRDYYFITVNQINVGVLRVSRLEDSVCKISLIFVLPEYQGKGFAQQAIKQVECLYPNTDRWVLGTIKQEPSLCYLYEKMGYVLANRTENIKAGMDIVYYSKTIERRD